MKLIQRKRTKGWRMPKGAIFIGRGTKWGNPFKVSEDLDARGSVRRYFSYLDQSIQMGGLNPKELKGKTLVCWCGDWQFGEPEIDCHGVLLLKIANQIKGQSNGTDPTSI